jgi:pimeloyl-ACP methyl ester carboxylesterase
MLQYLSLPLSRSKGNLNLDVQASDVFHVMHGETSWKKVIRHLIVQIENRKEPVIGLGHSFGGAIMVCAAASRPDLFRKLIIIGIPIY